MSKQQKIFFDIDNTICETPNGNYLLSVPVMERIKVINELYDSGEYKIVYWTSRGDKHDDAIYDMTKHQLDLWGCKYHKLKLGKPKFDLFVDNHACQANEFFSDPQGSIERDHDKIK